MTPHVHLAYVATWCRQISFIGLLSPSFHLVVDLPCLQVKAPTGKVGQEPPSSFYHPFQLFLLPYALDKANHGLLTKYNQRCTLYTDWQKSSWQPGLCTFHFVDVWSVCIFYNEHVLFTIIKKHLK